MNVLWIQLGDWMVSIDLKDALMLGHSSFELQAHLEIVLRARSELVWLLNLNKSHLVPSHVYLGTKPNILDITVSLPLNKQDNHVQFDQGTVILPKDRKCMKHVFGKDTGWMMM